jgi:hypothetical protein
MLPAAAAGATKNPARFPGRAHVVSFNFRNYADLAGCVKRVPWHNALMPRVDRYDIIGMVLLALVAALWILHFSLPAPPPPDIVP